ncbi:MAG TPA: phosphate acyltransferase PlsX [Planctomycetes bacterium]|nr:phosphate acyltransferase PlsX [Planctomycetota bacterium]
MRIALDTMGGDNAPEETLAGALCAVEKGWLKPEEILLVGPLERIQDWLDSKGVDHHVFTFEEGGEKGEGRFPILNADQIVKMDDSPVQALRQKPRSSLRLGFESIRRGFAGAMVSAGNTGAVVAHAVTLLKSLKGVKRPGIAVTIEGEAGPFTVIDVGANIQPKPTHLLHYGVMGACLSHEAHGVAHPRVGLLNIGGEAGKGNVLAKEVQQLFSESDLNFKGNIEGQDVFLGVCDVIVTEGFVGNVLLKLSEGLSTHLLHVVEEELAKAGVTKETMKEALSAIWRRVDYSEYGGALLLGIEGVVTICHGRSERRAFSNALGLAKRATEQEIVRKITERIATTSEHSSGKEISS